MRNRRAVTLLEVVVVLVILAILATVAVVTFEKVTSKSTDRSVEVEVETILTEAVALAALESRTPRVGDITEAISDSPSHRALTPGAASRHHRWISPASDATRSGAAMAGPRMRCTLGRTTGNQVEVWTTGNLGANCTGATALEGPTATPGYAAPAEVALVAPQNLELTSPDSGKVTATWDKVPGAAQYRVRSGDVTVHVAGTRATLTGLPAGEALTVEVTALDEAGTAGPPSSAQITTRPIGPWDAHLVWRYDNNTACYGGASSWTWQMVISSSDGSADRYRAEVRYVNDVAPGVSPWGGATLREYSDGYYATAEVQVCAPEGNPDPPFEAAKVTNEATREDVTLGRTGKVLLTTSQMTGYPAGSPLVAVLPER